MPDLAELHNVWLRNGLRRRDRRVIEWWIRNINTNPATPELIEFLLRTALPKKRLFHSRAGRPAKSADQKAAESYERDYDIILAAWFARRISRVWRERYDKHKVTHDAVAYGVERARREGVEVDATKVRDYLRRAKGPLWDN